MNVYLIVSQYDGDEVVHGVYTTRALAQETVDKLDPSEKEFGITWTVDEKELIGEIES